MIKYILVLMIFINIISNLDIKNSDNVLIYNNGTSYFESKFVRCYGKEIEEINYVDINLVSDTKNDFMILFLKDETNYNLYNKIETLKSFNTPRNLKIIDILHSYKGVFKFSENIKLSHWEMCIFTPTENNINIDINMIKYEYGYYKYETQIVFFFTLFLFILFLSIILY